MMSAEMQCAQGRGRIEALSGMTLIFHRGDERRSIHEDS
jgi:hypothetical protein